MAKKKEDAKGLTSTSSLAEVVEAKRVDGVYEVNPAMGDKDTSQPPKRPYFQKQMAHKQDHINIDCNVTMMDGKSTSRRVKIMNPEGCMLRSQVNNSEGIFQTLFGLLAEKYGANHIK